MVTASSFASRSIQRSDPRQAVLVLGMHRSGTSALTRVVNLLGAELPSNLVPGTSDNEQGYWESYSFFDLNEALLAAAGTRWHDDAPIPDTWFASEAAKAFRPQARALLQEAFHGCSIFVLKDPRLCRLLPFWRAALEDLGASPRAILIVRHPEEVFSSLAVRARHEDEGVRSQAITSPEKSHLLWLRYVLESERHTRSVGRAVVTYDGLLADWTATLQGVASEAGVLVSCFPG